MSLRAARKRGVRWLIATAEHAPPPERVHHQGRCEVAAVRVNGVTAAAVDLGGLEIGVRLLPEERAQLGVVEGGERPGQLEPGGAVRGVDDQAAELLPVRAHQVHCAQPLGRDAARGGLALAYLIAVEHEHTCAALGQLARDGEAGEAGSADQDVGVPRQGSPLLTPQCPSLRHSPRVARLEPSVPDTETLTQPKTVEGSGGLLLEIDGQIVPNYDATIVPFEEGDVVSGRVVQIDQDEVLVDIGYKSEGVIPMNELSIRKSVDPHDEVEMGEEVDALVLTKEDQDGRLLLSKKRARFEKAWRKIEAAAESGEPVEGTVIEVVKGGLIIDLGVRGFLPASLVDTRRVQNLDEFLGTKIECKVIELNRSRNNVVLSRRALLEGERKEARQQILDRLERGQVVEGTISNIVDFGAFVDLDGIDGLIHISELSWGHVNHPSEVLSIGDEVSVKVLDIDRDRQRISLGLKQTQEDPWERVVRTYNVGDVLEGTVTKVVAFGAFVEILEGVEGLVHISELAQQHVENQVLPRRTLAPATEGEDTGAGDLDNVPELGLSEDVFASADVEEPAAEAEQPVAEAEQPVAEAEQPAAEEEQPVAEAEQPAAEEQPAEEQPAEESEPGEE